MSTGARLIKRYTDLVTPDGCACMVYSGTFELGPLRLRFASTLVRDPAGRIIERRTLRDGGTILTLPSSSFPAWQWHSVPLDTRLEVRASAPPCGATLMSSSHGKIHWECVAPSADLVGHVHGVHRAGRGYCEELEMTVAPWHVPISTLIWGRFVVDAPGDGQTHVVWIKWAGPMPLSVVFCSGARFPAARIEPLTIAADSWHLSLTEVAVLREGKLGTGPLARIPGLARFAPHGLRRLLETHEHKVLSRGRLFKNGIEYSGWAISEVVQFGELNPEAP